KGISKTKLLINANGKSIPVFIQANQRELKGVKGFVESRGVISINASNYESKTEPGNFKWEVVENLGKTEASVISLPISKGRVALGKRSPKLSYPVNFKSKGKIKIHMYFAPTINYASRTGMFFGLSIDDEAPLLVNYDSDPNIFNYNGKVPKNWHQNVSDHIKIITTELEIKEPGNHVLNYLRVDEGLVLQKIVIETELSQLNKTYLGPPESILIN
ncbi:MAG TPA: glycosyl hydrolase, partial [Mariniflexile sp.]